MSDQAELPPKTRGLTAIAGAMSLIAVLLMVQIWLLTATLESFLKGDMQAAVPAAIFSGIILLICVGLYVFVDRVDSEVHQLLQRPLWRSALRALAVNEFQPIQDVGGRGERLVVGCPVYPEYFLVTIGNVHSRRSASL
jgi:Family of unknown function (DUF6755)